MIRKSIATISLFLASILIASAGPNVLIIGSSRDSNFTGKTSSPFPATEIRTQLFNILNQAGLGTVNVTLLDRSAEGHSTDVYSLAQWFHYPYPAGIETTTRWPNLRGEKTTNWDYVILIEDPYTMEKMPGLYAQGVATVAAEVAKGGAETVLLMPWPGSSSTSTVNHYRELVYRVGRTGGYKVAPAALAWEADGKPTNTTRNAFICASSIYSAIWGQSAKASGYVYNDTLADAVHTTTTNNNNAAQQFTGSKFNFQSPFLILGDSRRNIHFSEKGSSTEQHHKDGRPGATNDYTGVMAAMDRARVSHTNSSYSDRYLDYTPQDDAKGWPSANPMPIAFNFGRKFWEVSKQYETNPDYWQLGMGFWMQDNTFSSTVEDANDLHISQIFSRDVTLANHMTGSNLAEGQHSSARCIPWRIMWAQIHKEFPSLTPVTDSTGHPNNNISAAVGSYMYTIYSGRCPLNPQPAVITSRWYAEKVGYETAWRVGTGSSRAPGFKVMPSSATALTVTPSTTETMSVQFIFPPKNDVTVTISSSDTSAAIVGPQKLVFTPTNYNVPQSVKVAGVAGSSASAPFNVVYTTSSADPAYDGLSDSWAYTCERTATTLTQVNRGTTAYSTPKNYGVSINLNAAGASAANTTFAGPNNGTLSWIGSDVIYTPTTDYIGTDGFAFASLNGSTLTKGYIDITVMNGFPDGSVRAEVTDANAAEQGSDPGTITITRQGATTSSLAVNFTMSGTATKGSDYTLSANSPITIPAGQSSVVVTLTPIDDTVFGERIETATLTIASGTGYTAITNPVTISIADNDNTAPVVSAGSNQTVSIGAANLWTPASLTTALWLDAAHEPSVILNGSTVSSWNDRSGNNRHATQSTASAQPTLTAAAVNGRNTLTFDGSDFFNVDLDFLANTSHSAFIVTKTSGYNNIYGAATGNSGASSLHVGFSSNTQYRMNYWGNNWGTNLTTNFKANSSNILNFVWNQGGTKQIFTNGSSEGSATGAGTIAAMAGGGRICNVVGHGFYSGTISEIIMITGSVTEENRQKIEGYLAHKWGTQADLPETHPYKAAAPGAPSTTVTLNGSATDADGDPLTTTWSVNSKNPPTAPDPTFANTSQVSTTATFTQAGTYTLRLSVNDGYVTRTSDVTITVLGSVQNYALTVTNGTGDGTYAAGAQVTITADAPAAGYRFVNWTSSGGGSFGNSNSSSTTFTMPASAVTVTANYALNTAPVVNAGSDQTLTLQGGAGPAQMILAPTDSIQGFHNTAVGGNSTDGSNWPTAESPPKAIDGSTTTKYLNYSKVGSGFYVTPGAGATILTGVKVYTANDKEGRDPLMISIEGANGGDLSLGSSWTLIQDNINLGINTDPGRLKAGPLVALSASTSYTSYRIIVKSMRNNGENSVQYSEMELHGTTGTVTSVTLNGSATDADGDALTTTWSILSKNPATAADPTFANASQLSTTATFTEVGTYTLRLTANDGYASITSDVTITVNPALPVKYASWSGGTFTNPFTDTALTSNPDGDSMDNLMEFAFGTDPTAQDGGALAIDGSANGSPTLTKNAGTIEFYFVRRKDHGTSGSVSYTPQFSSNLSGFTDSPATPTFVANSSVNSNYEVVKVPFPNGTKFGRVEIVTVP